MQVHSNPRYTPDSSRTTPSSKSSGSGGIARGGRGRVPTPREARSTTVRFVNPVTAQLVATRLSHVQRTEAAVTNGAVLCYDFLEGRCPAGPQCGRVHVPARSLWTVLLPAVRRAELLYEEGFSFHVYGAQLEEYWEIPSKYVYVTEGSKRYIASYNEGGMNMPEKPRLCPDLMRGGSCVLNGACPHIHCCTADFTGFPGAETHTVNGSRVATYPRLPDDIVVRAQPPNGGDAESFPGGCVLRTAGADKYEAAFRSAGGEPELTMQHCAHFRKDGLCREGAKCNFLHVVSPKSGADRVSAQERALLAGMGAAAGSGSVTPLGMQFAAAAAYKARASQQPSGHTTPMFTHNPYSTSTSRVSPVGGASGRTSPSYRNNPYSTTESQVLV